MFVDLECALGVGQDVTTKNDKEIVTALRATLAGRVGKDRYEVWFGANTQMSVRESTLIISVPSRFFQDWLRSHFRKDLEAACEETFGWPMAIEFRIDSALATPVGDRASASESSQGCDPSETPIPSAKNTTVNPAVVNQPASNHGAGSLKNGGSAADGSGGKSCADGSEALGNHAGGNKPTVADAAPLGRRHANTLDSFVIGQSNCLAHKSVELASQQPGSLSPLVLHGPTGVGKTHLLEGMVNAFRKHRRQAASVYLSAEQFTSQFLEALHGSGLPSFRRKYRDVGLLVIDDIHFFAGKRVTLVELLHTIDTLQRAGSQLVFAADRSPGAIKALGPELIARLQGGVVCRLEPPEYATRLGIVRRLVARMEMEVPDDVQAYLAAHLTSQTRELAGALKRLHATSLALGRPITRTLAEEALVELIHQHGRAVRLPDIDKAVCEVFGLDPQSLQSGGKGKAVSHPRMLAMWLARKHTRAALNEIGQFFGRRSHSTVISAQRKVDAWMAKGASLSLAERPWNLDEAIRRVEEQLRAS